MNPPTTNSYAGFFIGPTNQNEYLGKYDQVLSDKDHAAASFFYLGTLQDAYGNGNIPYMTNQSFAKQSTPTSAKSIPSTPPRSIRHG